MIDEIKIMQLADGNLDPKDREEVLNAIQEDPKLQKILKDYEFTRNILFLYAEEIKSKPLPEKLLKKIEEFNFKKKIKKKTTSFSDFFNILSSNAEPVLAAKNNKRLTGFLSSIAGLAKVKPVRTQQHTLYQRGTNSVFKLSRSKLNQFVECQRFFYLDRVKGLKEPSMPKWTLNSAVDTLLKKEFDIYRILKKPHPIMLEQNLNFIPFEHEDLNKWRDSLRGGISFIDTDTNLEIYGGIDDLWFDKDKEELVVVDYKTQSSATPVEVQSYLNNPFHQSYKLQMDIYVYILQQMGKKLNFNVSNRTFFLVYNAEKSFNKFDNKLNFTAKLIPYEVNTSKLKNLITEVKKVLESEVIPNLNTNCEKCMYLEANKFLT